LCPAFATTHERITKAASVGDFRNQLDKNLILYKINPFVKTLIELKLTGNLQTCKGNEFIIGKFENSIKAGYRKDTFGCGGDIAENKSMSTIGQHFAQLQKLREAGRSYNINAGKINHYVTVASVTHNVRDGFQLVAHLWFLGQVHENDVLCPILNPHF
jgi:hypothetical protein